MGRIKIELPQHFPFETILTIRITDLNYGNHLGNDTVLSLVHEARVRFLQHIGYTELDLNGAGLIMSDAAIEYKQEGFYGDKIKIYIATGDFSRIGFDFFYKLVRLANEKETIIAIAKTGMVCYDYKRRKVVQVPEEVKFKLIS